LALELKKAYEDIIVVAPHDDYSERLRQKGLNLLPIFNLNRKGSNPIEDFRLFNELYKIFCNEKPDLALLFTIKINTYGGMAARLTSTKTICTVTGLGWLFTEKSIKTRLGGYGYKQFYKIAFSHAEHVVFQNSDDRMFFLQDHLVQEKKTVLTPGVGVDTGYFSPEFCFSLNKENKNGFIFLLMARMLWDKGIGEFVEAARIVKEKYPSADFWLLGPIDYENRSAIPEKHIREWEEKGYVKYKGMAFDVRPYICKCHVLVLPSYREAIGKSILEAMAMEKAIITTDAPGCRDTVDEGKNGFLVPVKDASALANAMMRYLKLSREEKEIMGKNSREKVIKEFDEKIVVNRYLNLIKKVLNS